MALPAKYPKFLLITGLLGMLVVVVWIGGLLSPTGGESETGAGRNQSHEVRSSRSRSADRPARTMREGDGMSPLGPLAGRLGTIFLDDSILESHERVEWLREYGPELNDDEINALLALLRSGKIPAGIADRDWHWIADHLLTELRNGTKDPKALTGEFERIFSDRSLDPVVRDYVLQHLGHLGHQGGDAGIIRSAALAGLTEIEGTIAGTALLVLHREPPFPNPSAPAAEAPNPARLAMEMVRNQNASTAAKVTALQVAAARDADGIITAANALLQSDAAVMIRIAAVAAVAEAGSNADLPILQELLAEHPFLQRAVRAGVLKLAAKD